MKKKMLTAFLLMLTCTVPVMGQEDGMVDVMEEENSPYAWYDEAGDVWYWNGTEDVYIGNGDEYYIEGSDYYEAEGSGSEDDDPEMDDYPDLEYEDEEDWDGAWEEDEYSDNLWFTPLLINVVNGVKENYYYEGELTPEGLAQGLSELTGMNFSIQAEPVEGGLKVQWLEDSTVIAGLDDVPIEDPVAGLEENVKWSMMDSLMETLRYDLLYANIWYTDAEGKPLTIDPIELSDLPYFGSMYYMDYPEKQEEITTKDQAAEILSIYLRDVLAEEASLTFTEEGTIEEDGVDAFFFELRSEYYLESFAVSKYGWLYSRDQEEGKYWVILPMEEAYSGEETAYWDDEVYWDDSEYQDENAAWAGDELLDEEDYWAEDAYEEGVYEEDIMLDDLEMEEDVYTGTVLIPPTFVGAKPILTENYGAEGYYYSSTTVNEETTIINACIPVDLQDEEIPVEEYIQKQMYVIDESVPKEVTITENKEFTEKLSYPVYIVSWKDENAQEPYEAMGYFVTTDTHDYLYLLIATKNDLKDFEEFAMETFSMIQLEEV